MYRCTPARYTRLECCVCVCAPFPDRIELSRAEQRKNRREHVCIHHLYYFHWLFGSSFGIDGDTNRSLIDFIMGFTRTTYKHNLCFFFFSSLVQLPILELQVYALFHRWKLLTACGMPMQTDFISFFCFDLEIKTNKKEEKWVDEGF